jgi:hypothetical protein
MRDFFHTGLQVGRSDIQAILGNMGPGNHWYVDYRNGSDGKHSNDGKSWAKAFKTYGAAVDAAVSNNNDFIHIDGDSEVVELSMVTLSKNRVHTVGHNGALPGAGYGPGARVSLGVTTAATDIATLKNTGVRNTFTGIKFSNSNTLATNLFTVAEGGEYSRFYNCEIYKSGLLTTDLTAPLLMNGDSSQFYGCTIGDLVNERGLTREQITGKVCRDGWFQDCRILTKAAHVDVCHVYGLGATAVERSLVFKDCIFWNCVLATADVADAVNFSAAQTQGDVLLINPSGMNISAIAGASLNIYVQNAPDGTTAGIAEEIAA